MKQKVLCLLIALPLMLVMRVLAAQDLDKRLFGKWQGTGVFHVLKLDLSSKGNYTIERDNKTVKSGRYKASTGQILFYPETGTESDESGFYELKGMDQLTVSSDKVGETWQNDPVSNAIKKGQDAIGESHAKVCDVTQTVTEPVSGTVETAQKKMEGVETAGSEVVRGVIEDTLNHSAEAQQKIYDEAKAYNSELSEELAKKAASASEKAVPKESGSGFFKTFGKLFKKSESGQMEKNHQGKNSSTNTQSNSNQLP